jgi:predicted Zn-dependent protease
VPRRPAPAADPEQRLEAALRTIVEQLPGATPEQRAFLLKRAGDVCVGLGEPRKALGWYGRAVDQHLELGEAEQAATLCRLIIYVQPEAVRARCTLTWIAIGTERHPEAGEQLGAYVDAARHAGQTEIAAQQLGWMFGVVSSPNLRRQIVAAMRALGHDQRADGMAEALRSDPAPYPVDRDRLWEQLMEATVRHQRPR